MAGPSRRDLRRAKRPVIALDTNILVYAHRRESEYHQEARQLVTDLAEDRHVWSVPWPCLYEFFSVVTNPRIWKGAATTPQQATDQIEAWLKSPSIRLLRETGDFFEVLEPLVRLPRVRGPIVHDARIAALCLAHGVDELLTRDRDFQLFPELKTRNPL